LKLVKNLLIH